MQDANWTILVLDDEKSIVELTTAILKQAGFNALGTTDPEEAVRLVDTNDSIRVLLSDVMMPHTTGPDVVRRALKRRNGSVRILFMSGGFQGVLFRETDPFLSKPLSFDRLLKEVRSAVSSPPRRPSWTGIERRRQLQNA